jgi:cytochrome c oxidase assembly protein subunit 15
MPLLLSSFSSASTPREKASQAVVMSRAQARVRNLVWKIAIATFVLMAIGSATRVMNAGLACPDWPLCYGTLFPAQQMNLQVFLEWFHRLDAALIGFMTLALAGLSWWQRRLLPTWLPGVATLALVLVCLQGLLGGLTVTELLRFDIVTAHLGTALLFFTTLLVTGVALQPKPASALESGGEPIASIQTSAAGAGLRWIGLIAALLVYGQSLTGGLVGSRWALHQCLAGSHLCLVMNSHLIGVIPASLSVLVLVIWAWRSPYLHPPLRRFAGLSGSFLLLQVGLGIATFRLHLQVEPLTVLHQAIGAALLGSLVCFTTFAWRDRPQ